MSEVLDYIKFGAEAAKVLKGAQTDFIDNGTVQVFDRFTTITSDGTATLQDAKLVAEDTAGAYQDLKTALDKLARNELAEPMQNLADVINGLDGEAVDNWLQIGKNIAYTAGAIIAAKKAYGAGMFLKDAFSKKGAGVTSGATNMGYGLGVQPVYVTNMNMLAGGGPDVIPSPTDTNKPASTKKLPKFFSKITKGASSLAKLTGIGYGLSVSPEFSPIEFSRQEERMEEVPEKYQPLVKVGLMDVIDELFSLGKNASTPHSDFNPYLNGYQPQSDQSNYPLNQDPVELQGKIKIEVNGNGSVTDTTINLPGVSMED